MNMFIFYPEFTTFARGFRGSFLAPPDMYPPARAGALPRQPAGPAGAGGALAGASGGCGGWDRCLTPEWLLSEAMEHSWIGVRLNLGTVATS